MAVTQFYKGSRLLQSFEGITGHAVDQINLIVCIFLSIVFGKLMRDYAGPSKVSKNQRMLIESALGLAMLAFCYGPHVGFLFVQSLVAYIIMAIFPASRFTATIITFWSMSYLAVFHLYRQHYDYGGYTMDITSPMMVQTQKLSSLAFNLYDGMRIKTNQEVNNPKHLQHAVLKLPNLLQYMSFLTYFHGVLCGPFVFYNDYTDYIDGYGQQNLPDCKPKLTKSIGCCIVYALMTIFIAPRYHFSYLLSSEFHTIPMSRKIFHTFLTLFLARQKYYFVWTLIEVSQLSAGMGFTGKNLKGETEWKTIQNFDAFAIEAGSSLKVLVDGWNIKTTHWLREVVYDRAPSIGRIWLVFITSAFWHGFYPGYYLMFGTFAMFTMASRILRRHIRPYFQKNLIYSKGYDVFTTIITRLAMTYAQAPFMLLSLEISLMLWKHFYFFPHTVALFIIFIAHLKPKLLERATYYYSNLNTKLS